MGVGKVVGVVCLVEVLVGLKLCGIVDVVVILGGVDDVVVLKDVVDGGFDVVFDLVCGQLMFSVLKVINWGVWIMIIGIGVGCQVNLDIVDLLFCLLLCIGIGQWLLVECEQIWWWLLMIVREQEIQVDYFDYSLEQVVEVWVVQLFGLYVKIIVCIC